MVMINRNFDEKKFKGLWDRCFRVVIPAERKLDIWDFDGAADEVYNKPILICADYAENIFIQNYQPVGII